MVDKKKLNRVKRVLSAGNGAELPKYTVKPGDTLSQIVLNYNKANNTNFTWQDVATWNSLVDPNKIYPGQIINFTNPQQATAITGANPVEGNPNASIEQAASANAQVNEEQTAVQVAKAVAQAVSSGNTSTISEQTSPEGQKAQTPVISPDDSKALKKAKGWGIAGQATTTALEAAGSVVGAKQEATDSATTKTADALYDTAAGVVENLGPYGKIVGTAMKFAGMAGDAIQAMGGGTDQQTTMDKWMDSSFFSWNIGMLNGFAGKNTDSFGVDQDVVAQVGSSYGGTVDDLNDAASKAGKKYGLFSSKARKKANAAIAAAKDSQNLMGNIADNATDQRLAVQSMGEQAGLAYQIMASGGYDQKYTYAAKQGGTLDWKPNITLELQPTVEWEPQIELNWELPTFKDGGSVEITEELNWTPNIKNKKPVSFEEWFNSIPEEYRASGYDYRKAYDVFEWDLLYKHAKDPEKNHLQSASPVVDENGNYPFLKLGKLEENPELQGEFDWYNSEDGKEHRSKFDIQFIGDRYYYVPRKLKNGGSVGDSDIPEIEETSQKNVIPEGALHKNKHHMEHAEGLTKKGIPVIDDEGEQQAEIEHSEIIFTLEVTNKLEEYYKIFYSEESSNKEKEQAAIDAGKLLVFQILENTEDRTGLIESCKKGGTLTLKTTSDDLIEEVLEWMPTVVIIEEKESKEKSEKDVKKPNEKSEKEKMKEAIKEVLIELLTS